ncbi:MAG: ADOP family duplicated permease [Longimicrobiales bacterium]
MSERGGPRGGGERGGRRAGGGEGGRIRRLFRIRRVERDIAEELGFHFARTVDDLVAGGLSRDAAEREARRRFGTEWWYRRELVRIDRSAAIRQWMFDRLRGVKDSAIQVLGALRRSPGLSAAIVAALALGIGVNGTMFRIVDRLWFSPPAHIRAPDEVVRVLVERTSPFSGTYRALALSYPKYQDLRSARGFREVSAQGWATLTLGHGEEAERAQAALVTGNYFRMLGVRAALGRFFDEDEDLAGAAPVIVLSHGYWQRALGGSAAVLGESIDFGHGPYKIIGVAPRYFTGVDVRQIDMWLPLHSAGALLYGDGQYFTGRGMLWLSAQARLAAGVTPAAAAAEATALHRAGSEAIEGGDDDAAGAIAFGSLIPARAPFVPPEMNVARWLGAVALLVLLIACVNVANLLLARVVRQRHEIGIRLALGVPRGRLVVQLLLEGLVLAGLGGALAFVIAYAAAPALGAKLLPDVDWSATALGGRAIAVTAAIALMAGLLAACLPAIQTSRRAVVDVLSSRAAGGSTRSTARLRGVLVLMQAALSVLLLVGAGLFVRSLDYARSADLGFEPDGLLVADLTFARGSMTASERAAYFELAADRLQRLPWVAVVAASATAPFDMPSYRDRIDIPGRDFDDATNEGHASLHSVSPGYFDALGTRLAEGRVFTARDRDGAPLVAVINQALARAGWPSGDAIGGCLVLRDQCRTVVGVVRNVSDYSFEPTAGFHVWMPAAQLASDRSSPSIVPNRLFLRAESDHAALGIADVVRRELIAMDPRVRFVQVRTMHEVMSPYTRSWELGASLFSAFGALALLLAALGLYSVLAFDVAQRMRELGVRVALGATRGRLIGDVIGRGVRVVGFGVGIGLVLAWLLAPRLADLLFGVSPRDVVSYGSAAIALLLVALLASVVPARTAIRADPVHALRSE